MLFGSTNFWGWAKEWRYKEYQLNACNAALPAKSKMADGVWKGVHPCSSEDIIMTCCWVQMLCLYNREIWPQLMLNRKWYQVSKPEMEFHMINIIYASLPLCAQTDKTTFSCKDDFKETKHTRRWTYSTLRYFSLFWSPLHGSMCLTKAYSSYQVCILI